MKTREELLLDLVFCRGNIEELENKLAKYSWDVEEPLLKINTEAFISVLKKCIDNEINFNKLILWANAIECRDDLDFENEIMQEVIFDLANPEINGAITSKRLLSIMDELNQYKV